MGMFDTIVCYYDLGAGFYRKPLQTKCLDQWMGTFFLDPKGHLWEIDYSDTQDFSRENPKGYVPNGLHGKVRPYYVTATIEVYPAVWDAHYAPFPRLMLEFVQGQLFRVKTPGQVRL